jgi:hypothetical protein
MLRRNQSILPNADAADAVRARCGALALSAPMPSVCSPHVVVTLTNKLYAILTWHDREQRGQE